MIGSKRHRYRAAVEAAAHGQNPNDAVTDNYSRLDKLAVILTGKIGTMRFTLVIMAITFLWIGYNCLAPAFGWPQFDKLPSLVVYLLAVNIFGTILMPLLMVGQNLQCRQQEAKTGQDYENNKRALEILENLIAERENEKTAAYPRKIRDFGEFAHTNDEEAA
jgi:uncharacterized membrane protein